MRKLKGKDLMIFLDEGEGYKAVACSLSCSLEVEAAIVPTLSVNSWKWNSAECTSYSWTMSAECFVKKGKDPMRLLGKTVKVMIGSVPDFDVPAIRSADGRLRRYGEAVVTSIREVGELRGMAKSNIAFQGSGELRHDPQPMPHGSLWINYEKWIENEIWIE